MNLRPTLVLLAWLSTTSFAQNIQPRAEALIEHARQLSDIRSANAPAFRLKATFSFVGANLETVEGTYTEIWISPSRWRRETVAKDFRRIEVADSTRLYRLDSTEDFPARAARIPGLVAILPSTSDKFDFESLTEQMADGVAFQCAVTRPGPHQERYAFCFDKKSGVLIEKASPEMRPHNLIEYSCYYDTFKKLGSFLFPGHLSCFQDRHRSVDVKVVELSLDQSPDHDLFTAPPGSIELANCSTKEIPPVTISAPQPSFPFGTTENTEVTLGLLIDIKGHPQTVTVTRSGGKQFDKVAVNTVRRWRFKPATCNGEPVPTQIAVEMNFSTP
jgi:TonB family protein